MMCHLWVSKSQPTKWDQTQKQVVGRKGKGEIE